MQQAELSWVQASFNYGSDAHVKKMNYTLLLAYNSQLLVIRGTEKTEPKLGFFRVKDWRLKRTESKGLWPAYSLYKVSGFANMPFGVAGGTLGWSAVFVIIKHQAIKRIHVTVTQDKKWMRTEPRKKDFNSLRELAPTNHATWKKPSCGTLYRDRLKRVQILLSNSQAGPGRKVKQEQEEISRNHVQAF